MKKRKSFLYNYVDYIWCVHDLAREERLENLDKQFDFLGIDVNDSSKFSFMYSIIYDAIFEKEYQFYIRTYELARSKGYIMNTGNNLNHNLVSFAYNIYKIFKISLAKGYKKILVFENDILSYSDKKVMKKYLDNIPEDANCVSLSSSYDLAKKDLVREIGYPEDNQYYIDEKKFSMSGIYSCSACIFDGAYMNSFIKLCDEYSLLVTPDWYYIMRQIFNLNIYYSDMSMFIQMDHVKNKMDIHLNEESDYSKYINGIDNETSK